MLLMTATWAVMLLGQRAYSSASTAAIRPPPPSPPPSSTTIITPLPKCFELRPTHDHGAASTLPRVNAASVARARSDDAFSTRWLAHAVASACDGGDGGGDGSGGSADIALLLPGAAQEAALQQRGLRLAPHLGTEGYIIDVARGGGRNGSGSVLVAARNRSGVFHGVQTLVQMLRSSSGAAAGGGCVIDEARVEDWPDAPMRGVYAVGGWYDAAPPGNASFLNATLDAMARAKHSFIMFNANGAELLFQALLQPNSSSARRTMAYYQHWQAECVSRGIELIPQITAASSGPNDYVNANTGDGIWVQNESFVVGADDVLRAAHAPATTLPNANFSEGLRGWRILKHGDNPDAEAASEAPKLCWYHLRDISTATEILD
jgi:hypothetical protein